MNKQIKSFLVECGAELVKETHNGQSGTAVNLPNGQLFDFEKFAKLIVKECAIFSMVNTDDHYDVDALYKHFGIEE